MLWFSKRPKLSKEQYEEARKHDEFKIMSRDEWIALLSSIKGIYQKYQIRDSHERYNGEIFYNQHNWYPCDENGSEYWYYDRIKSMLESIGDGWGSGYIHTETVYLTDDFIISDASGHHTFTELDNGDLLVEEKIVTKKQNAKTITEIDGKRYKCGKWRKKIIETEYKKQLIDDYDYNTLGKARIYCKNYEYIEDKTNDDDSCEE